VRLLARGMKPRRAILSGMGLTGLIESGTRTGWFLHVIANASEIKVYFAQYIPLISRRYWSQLPEDLRNIIRESWESGVNEARLEAAKAQSEAQRTLLAHGVKVLQPTREAMQAWRDRGMAGQGEIAKKLGVPEALVKQAQQALMQTP